jgi:hypothetical protein
MKSYVWYVITARKNEYKAEGEANNKRWRPLLGCEPKKGNPVRYEVSGQEGQGKRLL